MYSKVNAGVSAKSSSGNKSKYSTKKPKTDEKPQISARRFSGADLGADHR